MSTAADTSQRGVLWALCGALLTALFMVPWRLAGAHGDPSDVVLVMLVVAAAVNTAASVVPARRAGRPLPATRLMLWVAAGMALLTLAGNQASAASIQRIDGPMLSLLQRLEVVVVTFGAALALGERIEGRFFIGAAVAGVGLWLITSPELGVVASDPTGIALGLLSAVAFGAMNVLVRRHAHEIHHVTVNALRLWLAVALWFVVEARVPDVGAYDLRMVGFAALSALSGPVLARLSIMRALQHTEARIVVLVLLSTPVLTLFTSGLFLGEWPGTRALQGGALMLVGIGIPVVGRALWPAPVSARV